MQSQGWHQRKNKIIIGLTGTFGSGKTTVARILGSYGAKIIDADKLAHNCIIYGKPAYKKIINTFGREILKRNKTIDRRKLAAIVFNNKGALLKLNKIIHPQVIRAIKSQIDKAMARVMILDAPLLIEAGLEKMADKLIVVTINRAEQIKRIRKKTFLTKEDILKRIKCQIPLYVKVGLADFVIDNSGTKEETRKQAGQIRRRLWKN